MIDVKTHYNTKANMLKYHYGLTENKGNDEEIFINKGSHHCSGDFKRIRLKYKYATRPAIYTKR